MSQRALAAAVCLLVVLGIDGEETPPKRPVPNFDVAAPLWKSGDYEYDGAGNVVEIGDDRYDYDLAGRITEGTAHTKTHANSETFEYDIYGNLKTIQTKSDLRPATNAPWVARLLTIDSATNRILKPCGAVAGCAELQYDPPSGNLTADSYATYAWDLVGNMQQLQASGRKERYLYDALNQRVATITVADQNHEFRRYTVRDLANKVLREATDEVTNGTHAWKWDKDYVRRGGGLLATVVPTDTTATSEETGHFHVDHLGTPRVITDAYGYRRSLHTYWPYGTEAPGSDFSRERMRFTGHERDFADMSENDLDYMGARYYRPAWGRFTSPDKVGGKPPAPQSWNRYVYALGSPLKFVDPDGNRVAVVYGKTMNVNPGDVIVLRGSDGGVRHVAMIAEFSKRSDGRWSAHVVEHAPQEGRKMRDGKMAPDHERHELRVVDSNSPNAGGGIWNAATTEVSGHVRNYRSDGLPFSEKDVISAMVRINENGGLRYDNLQEGQMASTTDCAGGVNQMTALLRGTAQGVRPFSLKNFFSNNGTYKMTDWQKEADAQAQSNRTAPGVDTCDKSGAGTCK